MASKSPYAAIEAYSPRAPKNLSPSLLEKWLNNQPGPALLPQIPVEASIAATLLSPFTRNSLGLFGRLNSSWSEPLITNAGSNVSWFLDRTNPFYYTANVASLGNVFGSNGFALGAYAGAQLDNINHFRKQLALDAGPVMADSGDFSFSLAELKRLRNREAELSLGPAFPMPSNIPIDMPNNPFLNYDKINADLISKVREKQDLIINYLKSNGTQFPGTEKRSSGVSGSFGDDITQQSQPNGNLSPETEWASPDTQPSTYSLGNYLPYLANQASSGDQPWSWSDYVSAPRQDGGWSFSQYMQTVAEQTSNATAPADESFSYTNPPINSKYRYQEPLAEPSLPSGVGSYLDFSGYSYPEPSFQPAAPELPNDNIDGWDVSHMIDPNVPWYFTPSYSSPQSDSSSQKPQLSPIDYAGSAIGSAYNILSYGSTLQDVLTGRRSDPGAYLSLANGAAQGINWVADQTGIKDIIGAIGDLQDPLDTVANVTGGAVAGWGARHAHCENRVS